MNDWANPVSSDDGPDEEGNPGGGNDVSLDCEQVTDLVDWEPDRWQRAQPEDEERDKIHSGGARVGDAVVDLRERGPDRRDHKFDAFASDPGLNTVPNTCHSCSVEDGPETSPDSKGAASDDRERNVIGGTDATSEDDEACCDGVSEPDTNP